MKGKVFTVILALLLGSQLYSQETKNDTITYDNVNMGIGIGQDYGGIGVSLMYYPKKQIGLFVGGGYAFAGFGYNVGAKVRFVSSEEYKPVNFFLIGMYGYNASVAVTNAKQYNKLFYGPTLGFGIDIGPHKPNKGYFSLSINIPYRSPDVNEYKDDLEADQGVEFNGDLLPFTFSLGYKFSVE